MANRYLGPRIESEVPEVRVSVETAKIGLAEIHQNPEGTFGVAAIFAVIGFRNRVRKRVIRIGSRQHLLHLEFSPCATGDNRFGAHSSIGSPSSAQYCSAGSQAPRFSSSSGTRFIAAASMRVDSMMPDKYGVPA